MPKKQKSGLYRTKIKIGVDAQGRDINKWVSGRTMAELEEAKREARAYYIEGSALQTDQLFGAYATTWYHVRKEPRLSDSSKAAYRCMFNKWVLPAFGDRNLRAIQPFELQQFVDCFSGSSKSQITLAMTILDGVFSSALTDRIVSTNPASGLVRPTATPAREKRALTEEERARVEAVCETHPHGKYLAVLYYTGVRPGEARGLQWGDLDWDAGLIHVQRDVDYASKRGLVGALKTPSADRYIPIHHRLEALLRPSCGPANAFLFEGKDGKPLAQVTATRIWIELMDACGLVEPIPQSEQKYGKWDIRSKFRPLISPHTMRHNFITMCWEAGMDVLLTMRIVGHADYQTTMNIYTHLSDKHLERAKEQLEDVFSAKAAEKRLQTL